MESEWQLKMAEEVVVEPRKPPTLFSYMDSIDLDSLGDVLYDELELDLSFMPSRPIDPDYGQITLRHLDYSESDGAKTL